MKLSIFLLFLFFLFEQSTLARQKCVKSLTIDGYSSHINRYQMSLEFCPNKKIENETITHVNYLNKRTKTVFLDKVEFNRFSMAINKLSNEILEYKMKNKEKNPRKCFHPARVNMTSLNEKNKNLNFILCKRSAEDFFIKMIHEIIRAVYYSK
jgi:hypothetical protein